MAKAHGGELTALKRAVEKVDKANAERDRLIVAASTAKVPVPQIAAAIGLSRARIYQILGGQSS